MSDAAGTIEKVVFEISKLLAPLKRDLATPEGTRAFLQQMGFALTPAQVAGLSAPLSKTAASTDALIETAVALISAIEAENFGTIAAKSIEAVQRIAAVITDIDALGSPLGAVTATPPAAVAQRLFDYLLFSYLERTHEINDLLELLGVLKRTEPDNADPPFTIATFDFGQFGNWLSKPGDQVKTLYDWSTPGFDGRKLFAALERVLGRAGLPVFFDETGPEPRLDVFIFDAVPKTGPGGKGLQFRLRSDLPATAIDIPAGPDAKVNISLAGQIPSQTSLTLFPDGGLAFKPPAGPMNGEFGIGVTAERTSPPSPFILFGQSGSSRLELAKFAAKAGTRVTWSGTEASGAFKFEANADHLKLLVDATSSDGFLTKILPGTKFDADFSLVLGISSEHGLYFGGSSALQIQLPLHLDLGPVSLNALTIAAGIDNGKFPVSAGVNIKAALGPLQAVVENIGVTALIEIVNGNKGNLGPLKVGIGFKPPNGVGLSLDVGVVKGGGYLFIDAERGEYAGALELALANIVTIKAIGIINTKMPDGSKGFSLLILMSVEFGTGIQLGFGFTLLAVGGLVGLNRTMKLDKLAEGIRSGAIESVMFPRDIIANAPKIISDLKAFFPPEEGKFLIGPMVKLGWGTPTLVSLSMGIIIEIPGNIAIVGVLQIALPTVDAALIKLQVNFIGAIEFDKKRIWFFASLFDSRVIFLTINGEMGLLVAFGNDANFVVSVGGFHPRFSPPPLPFPSPVRVAIDILNNPLARIRVEGYFAVTSNTAQFGARVEVFFGLSALNVQGHLGFDALFQFSPFYFIIEISASLSVKVFGVGLLSVDLHGSLEGPAPWHIEGHGSISLLFFDIDVDFAETWGENKKAELPPIMVLDLIRDELNKAENWRAFLPEGATLFVSLRKMPEGEAALILHPVGKLRVSQRALPLDFTLEKVGTRKPKDVKRVGLSVDGGGLAKKSDTFEQFAPAQYQNFKDADKLSRPAYAPEHGGLELSAAGQDMRSSRMVRRNVRYEEIIIDSNFKRFARRFGKFVGSLFNFFLAGNAASRLAISQAQGERLQPFHEHIAVLPETYSVALQTNNAAFSSEAVSFHSEASARDFMKRAVANDPALAGQLHVVPAFERAA
jgi:hypothetical protein